ncbi:MAG: NAD(P)/FAD-dependent oxidoreductase [Caldilinea sp.]
MAELEPIVVIGAGVGGLTTAALLAQAGLDVTVLEAHVYPGGCAGTFFHKNYRFEAGATLAGGFYPGGPMDIVGRAVGIERWPAHPSEPSMAVHLPDGQAITRYGDERRREEHGRAFGKTGDSFWRWQENRADALWDLALRTPAWPPQSVRETGELVGDGLRWLSNDLLSRLNPQLLADAFRPVAAHLQDAPKALRLFVDAQLLIAAQTTSAHANALYGASALDLPRRGVVHLEGGIGAIAETLADAVRRHGGKVLHRQEVDHIVYEHGRPVAVETRRGQRFPSHTVIANLPPWNIARLAGDHAPAPLQRLPQKPEPGWGAFMVYVGFDEQIADPEMVLHHQVIEREPLGEGNSIFLSLSPAWDRGRAPAGRRALTISTHTALEPWWKLFQYDKQRYEQRKAHYAERMVRSAERILPGLRAHADLVMPGTPVTFQRFTRRVQGWVGGFPQTSLFQARGPRLDKHLWMVGDSIFPGQSTAAVALGGLRVAHAILAEAGVQDATSVRRHTASQTAASEAA